MSMDGSIADRPEIHLGEKEARKLKEAEKAFLSRPRVSIRLRIVGGFLAGFFLMTAAALVNLGLLYKARSEARFLKVADSLLFDVAEARRFEKNYFLTGKGIEQSFSRAGDAVSEFEGETVTILSVAGRESLLALGRELDDYKTLLGECRDLELGGGVSQAEKTTLEKGLGLHGEAALRLLRDLSLEKAGAAERTLILAQAAPFIALLFLLLLIFWMTHLLAKTITQSLARFHEYTQRVTDGDFSPITPVKPYHDEFSDLAMATNRMLFELRAKEAQAIRAGKLAAVGSLTAGIAHELVNPLTNISITAESLAMERGGDPLVARLAADISGEAERADAIIKNLMSFTSDELAEKKPLDIRSVVAGAARLLENEMALHNVAYDENIPSGLPAVFGSEDQLRQLFFNLLMNGVEAMSEGGTLRVTARRLEGETVCVEVSDSGRGIKMVDLPHVFDPFFTTKPRSRGTGLGLTLVHAIARKHGGQVQIESIEGKGTTVHVCLPATINVESAPTLK